MKNNHFSTLTILDLSFLSSFLIFLFVIEAQARDPQPYYCTSSCGDIQNISYPFRPRGQPLSRGDPDYTLSCETHKTIMEFGAGKYYVQSINYEKQIIRIVDINLAHGSCNLPSGSLDSGIHGDIRYQNFLPHIEIVFVNCSKAINDSTFHRVSCMSGNDSIIYAVYSSASIYEYQHGCSFPISMTLLNPYDNARNPSPYEDIQKLLMNGFDLGWSVECRDCIESGRECEFYNDPKPHYRCHKPCKAIN